MGCTPSKQVDASKEGSNGSDYDASAAEQLGKDHHTSGTPNGSSKNNSNGNVSEKNKNHKNHISPDAKATKSRPILTSSKSEKKCTQSQLDFFEMLDRKIDAGADYISEDDRASRRSWSELR
eukprot:Seg4063.2 transcript_id=Seg4063.2/GoldUCD/mRNA.D3Y31 product="hypothetical protein" protein_id=Seg4063.2/GoldUCD/D3Y31